MRFQLHRRVGSFKSGLFLAASIIVLAVVLFTNRMIGNLRQDTRKMVQFQVEHFRSLFLQEGDALERYLEEMANKDFPLIIADSNHEPTSWSGLPEVDDMPDSLAKPIVKRLQHAWTRQGNSPVKVDIPEYGLTLYFYYGDSDLIRQIRILPFIEVLLVGALILVGYWGFVVIKRSEQGMVWVGMAKETAHQMGTPLTSLMGWVELLGEDGSEMPDMSSLRTEMKRDLERLSIVAQRFNRLGTKSGMKQIPLKKVVGDAVAYIQRRLPHLSGNEITLSADIPEDLIVEVNPDLFGWVIENLLKNGAEALQSKGGEVKVTAHQKGKKIFVDVKDNGSGIARNMRRNVFRPGFSSKKRGWGLGLSLAKRLVENIHNGKINVLESKPGIGTTIRITLQQVGKQK